MCLCVCLVCRQGVCTWGDRLWCATSCWSALNQRVMGDAAQMQPLRWCMHGSAQMHSKDTSSAQQLSRRIASWFTVEIRNEFGIVSEGKGASPGRSSSLFIQFNIIQLHQSLFAWAISRHYSLLLDAAQICLNVSKAYWHPHLCFGQLHPHVRLNTNTSKRHR